MANTYRKKSQIQCTCKLENDDTEDEVWKGVREMADAIELGRPYLDAVNPSMFDE